MDLFRKKVLGEFPKVDDDVLIPLAWIEAAQKRWRSFHLGEHSNGIRGIDVAGMGRDCTCFCDRYGDYVERIEKHNSGGKADHMKVAGAAYDYITHHTGACVSIDTIGEGAGVFSRLDELHGEHPKRIPLGSYISCKYSEAARARNRDLTDTTAQYRFANLRAYCLWAVREWLNPANGSKAMLPPSGTLAEEATEIRWSFRSDGRIVIEPKEDIKSRLGYSPDEFDALANTFHPQAVQYAADYYYHRSGEDELTDEDLY